MSRQILDVCLRKIEDCEQEFSEALAGGSNVSPALRVMLERALVFARDNIDAIAEQLDRGRIPQTQILFRPFFECSANFLWASLKPDGWQSLRADAAKRDISWAQKAIGVRGLGPTAKGILNDGRLRAAAQHPGRLPNKQRMLEEIEELDRQNGLRPQDGARFAPFSYFAFYRLCCRPIHAHIAAIGPQPMAAGAEYIGAGVLNATLMLCRAVYHVLGWDNTRMRALAVEFRKVLRPD